VCHASQALELLALQMHSKRNSVSETRNSSFYHLITLKSDSTVGVPGKTVAMPPQNCLNLEKRTPKGRHPSAKLTMLGLIFKLFT
jgi:hypothetical protein